MPRINYEIPADLHRRAKIAAAVAGRTLHDLIVRGLELAVEEAEREGQK